MANSNLLSNLNAIYATKLEIKNILNTESDDFAQYPDLIEVAIASGGATGTYNITENGTFDVATYASAYVDVPQREVPVVPPGYSYVSGTKEIFENGTIDISSYANAYVNVPAPEGWILPSGYAYITANGNFDIREFEAVNVNVPTGGATVLGNLSVTENGQYSASAYSYDGFDTVDVNVPIPTLGSANITANGVYNASDLGYDGLNSVTINVPTSGGGSSHTGSSVYDAMTIKEALDWVYANLKVGESSSDWFYVKGIIAEASSPITAQYGNFNAWLTDDGQMHYQTEDPTLSDLTKCLYVFRGMFYGHSTEHATWDPNTDMQIHVGDQVIMYCQLRYHTSGVPRIINGSTIKQGVTAQNQLTISQSGTYDVQNYVSAYVNVPGGGSSNPTLSVSGEYGMYSGKYYIYDTNLMTYLTLLNPITNTGLGDTVSGTVEYSDIDGSGMPYKYICKNFKGTSVQDSDRVYTSLNVNKYYGTSSSMLLSTVGGDISSNYYSLESENGVTYYLPGNYSGSTFESGSTVNCYVSTDNAMGMEQYLINEVVNVVNPNLTGVSYSTDGGTTWNAMVSDTIVSGYSADNLGISIDPMNSNSLNIRFEYDNGSYKYVSNYISITSGMKPYSSMIQKDTMMMTMTIQNDSESNIEISKIGVNTDTIFVYWEQGVTYDYYLMSYNSDNSYKDKQQLVDNSWNDIQISGDYFLIGKYQGATQEAILYANTSNYTDGDNASWYVLDTTGTNVGSSGSYKILNTNNLDKIYWNKLSSNIKGGLSNRITVKNASDDSTITTIKENYSSNIQLATSTDIYIVNNVNNNTFKLNSAATASTEFPNNYSFYNTSDHANATYNLTVPAGTWDLGFTIGAMNEILLNTTYYNS